jgi:hypothetical protein
MEQLLQFPCLQFMPIGETTITPFQFEKHSSNCTVCYNSVAEGKGGVCGRVLN